MRFQAVLFDFDGLILDTETPDFRSWCEVFEAHGCDLPLAVWAQAVGAPSGTFDECAYLEGLLGRAVDRVKLRRQRQARFHELVSREIPRPGVIALAQEARDTRLRTGIASSADRPWIEGHLEHHALHDAFEVIRCLDDVRNAKPHPEVYEAAAAALGVPAHSVLVFEDSPNGIRAAKRAGMTCVAVPNPVTEHLDLSEADLIQPGLGGVNLAAVMRGLGE